MLDLLTYISLIAGGLLVILLLLSLLGGLDLDLEMGSDVDSDSGGGLGIVKSLLTFLSVGSWVIKVLLNNDKSVWFAVLIGIVVGFFALLLLSYFLKLLLKNEENVNWEMDDSLFQRGEVYLKIPKTGSGLVNVNVNGAIRELKAKSKDNMTLKTGDKIVVVGVEGEYVLVQRETS